MAIGAQALKTQIGKSDNIAIGRSAMKNSTAYGPNIAIGTEALENASVNFGNYAIAIGHQCLKNNQEGDFNLGIGHLALSNSANNTANTAVGFRCMTALVNGNFNTGTGADTLVNLVSGTGNTAFGYNAASSLQSGDNNICIGFRAQPSSPTVNNEITLGNSFTATLRCNVPLTVTSDQRDKTDIEDLNVGLDFIEKLKPVKYKWDKREWYGKYGRPNGSKKENKVQCGLLAQDLDAIQEENDWQFLNLVYKNNPDKLEVTYTNIIFPMIKAIQDLNSQIERLEEKIKLYENKA